MKRTQAIYLKLKEAYPDARCELNYKTPFQLVVATLLSAQATDKSVNAVTKTLFEKYPDVESFLPLSMGEIENEIRKIGLYKNKAKSIYNLCRELNSKFNGQVPKTMEELVTLSGVGRKTASVVMAEGFKIPAFPVDTHILRLASRLGMSKATVADKVSDDIMKDLAKKYWINAHHVFIFHGRRTCIARNPKCEECVVKEYCKYIK